MGKLFKLDFLCYFVKCPLGIITVSTSGSLMLGGGEAERVFLID